MASQINDNYIFNPGYVNFLILQLRIFHDFTFNGLIGLFLNILLLISIRSIIRNLIGVEAVRWGTILFCLLSSNWFSIIPTMTELFFSSLLYLSLTLIRKNYWWLIVSGLLMCYANYTRPLFVIFALPVLLYMIYLHFGWKRICTYFVSYSIFTLIITGLVLKYTDARGTADGTTMGVNLAIGANDSMNGRYNKGACMKGEYVYIDDPMTAYDKNKFWRDGAVQWIKEHPLKYVAWMPVKLANLWWGDYYYYGFIDGDMSVSNNSSFAFVMLRIVKIVIFSMPYYVILVLFAIGLWKMRSIVIGLWGVFMLPVILASGMHMVLYGGIRYHYPYVPVLILYAVIGILSIKYKNINFLKR